ncbi:MAG: hypothetical protein ABI823_09530 [Bryobacteraceae bacterium]
MRTPFRFASLVLLGSLFVVNVYRAASQSITHDEALTYLWFVAKPWAEVFTTYDANHHVLFTILCKVAVSAFGPSEFVMRLPTLLACLVYFWAMFRLCEAVFGIGWRLFLAVAALSLHPLILDFLSAARGYGLALAFFTLGLVALLRFLRNPAEAAANRWLVVWPGLILALAVCSNLIYLVPVTGAILTSLSIYWLDRHRSPLPPESGLLALPAVARLLIAPFLTLCWLVLIFPLSAASPDHFYYGAHSWRELSESLAVVSFLSNPAYALLPNTMWLQYAIDAGIAIALLGLGLIAFRNWRRADAAGVELLLLAGTTFASLVAITGGFAIAGIALPVGRTLVYWIFLLTFAGLLVIRFAPGPRWVSWLLAVPMLVVLAQYALEWRTTFYGDWLFHRDFRSIISYISKDHSRLGAKPVIVAGSWEMAAPLNYYRETRNLNWMAPMERETDPPEASYWIFAVQDAAQVEKRGLKTVWKDPLSGTVLAVRP